MKKIIYPVLAVIILAITIAGYKIIKSQGDMAEKGGLATSSASNKMTEQDKKMDENKNTGEGVKHEGAEAKLAGSRIDLQSINKFKPGEVTLAFKLYGLDTHEFVPKDLKTNNERLMHLFLVRDDLTEYQHLHPDYVNERWTITAQVRQAGDYNLYVNIEPIEEKATVLRLPVVIGEPTAKKNYPKSSRDFSEMLGDLTAKLDLTSPIKAGTTKFSLKLTQNNNPVSELDSYLGAFSQAVIFEHTEPGHFEYTNTLTQEKPTDGVVKFEANFSEDGMYTIFAQFNLGGQTKIFPITVKVGENQTGDEEM